MIRGLVGWRLPRPLSRTTNNVLFNLSLFLGQGLPSLSLLSLFTLAPRFAPVLSPTPLELCVRWAGASFSRAGASSLSLPNFLRECVSE